MDIADFVQVAIAALERIGLPWFDTGQLGICSLFCDKPIGDVRAAFRQAIDRPGRTVIMRLCGVDCFLVHMTANAKTQFQVFI